MVATASTRLFVYEWGEPSGQALVFWTGQGGTGLNANEIAPILAREYGTRVIAPDPPGHGLSPSLPLEAFRPSALAELAAVLLDALEVERVAFVGFSWGAEIGCAYAARFPRRTTSLVLVDGGYHDLADIPGFDRNVSLSVRLARARERAAGERYASWDAFFAAQRDDLKRWTNALAESHRASMREEEGQIVPILSPDVNGAINYWNCLEPNVSTYPSLREAGVPILLLTPADHGTLADAVQRALVRFQAEVPQLRVEKLPGNVHDLVSNAPAEVASTVGRWLENQIGAGEPRHFPRR